MDQAVSRWPLIEEFDPRPALVGIEVQKVALR